MNRKFSISFKKSFGFKLFKAFIVIIILVLWIFTLFSVLREYKKARKTMAGEGETLIGLLACGSKLGVFSENGELLKNIADGVVNHKDVVALSIYNADLKALYVADKEPSSTRRHRKEEAINKKIADKITSARSLDIIETWNTFEFLKPVVMETIPHTEDILYFGRKDVAKTEKIIGYVRIVFKKDSFHREILSILSTNAAVVLIFILSSIAIIYFAVKRTTNPLEKLMESAKRLGMGENPEKIPVESEDEIGRLAATFNEMSENLRKRDEEKRLLEENLSHAKKMEAVGTLARGIAHDFNNILGTIKGSAYMLKKKLGDDDPLQKYTENIHNSVMRAKDLIQALLVFSKTQKIHSSPVYINALIKEMNPMFSSAFSENIEYVEILTDEPLVIIADCLNMELVVTNIISNALDAMPEGGRLFIKTEVAHIDTEETKKKPFKKPGRYALISISDTGVGMGEEIKNRIFEPFFTTKEVGKGTGLGLSIVYGIIKEHRGYIDVDTQKGEGTIFKIYLPLIEPTTLTPP